MYGISYFDLSLLTLAVCCGLCVLVAASLVNSLFWFAYDITNTVVHPFIILQHTLRG